MNKKNSVVEPAENGLWQETITFLLGLSFPSLPLVIITSPRLLTDPLLAVKALTHRIGEMGLPFLASTSCIFI